MKILLIEDEEKLASFVQQVLEGEKMSVTVCDSVEVALANNYQDVNDLIILDLMLPGKSGDFMISTLRKVRNNIPILVLSALGQICKKIEMLNLGADDYLTKPFNADELVARVYALYRRYLESKQDENAVFGDIVFFRKQNKLVRSEKDIFLTQKEGAVFGLLLCNEGRAVRTEDILMKVWHAKQGYHSNIVQATIRRLRKKIDSGYLHKLIKNIHGIGYMIVLEQNNESQ